MVNTLFASRRSSTVRIYNGTWKVFYKWCHERGIDPLHSSHKDVLSFLQDGLKAHLKLATLRRQVAALDSIFSTNAESVLSSHPLIRRFLKGAASICPPQTHRFPTWKLNVVLNALTKSPFEPLAEVDLKWVRMKTVFLVAITSARRISELSALSCHSNLCVFHRDKVVLRTVPSFIPKVATRFHMSQ